MSEIVVSIEPEAVGSFFNIENVWHGDCSFFAARQQEKLSGS